MLVSDLKAKLSKQGFKPVPGYDEAYWCSRDGRIFSVKCRPKRNAPLLLKLRLHKEGYLCTSLWRDGKGRKYLAHRLIAKTWLRKKPDLPHINHINGIKTDNRVQNLEWTNFVLNNEHSRKVLGHSLFGEKNPAAVLDPISVKRAKALLNQGMTRRRVEILFGVSQTVVQQIATGKHWAQR